MRRATAITVEFRQRRHGVGEVRRERPARQRVDLERANHPLAIGGLNARGRRGIHARQHAGAARRRRAARHPFQPRPQGRIGRRSGKQPAREGAEVEAGAADEDRQPAAPVDVADGRRRVAREPRGGVLVGGIDDVDEVVRDAAPLGDRHLVGADVEAAVDGRGVAVDDLAAEALGGGQRQRRLARGRRSRESPDSAAPRAASLSTRAARAPGPAAPSTRPRCRPAARRASSALRRRLVVEERHREERLVGRILRRQRRGGFDVSSAL